MHRTSYRRIAVGLVLLGGIWVMSSDAHENHGTSAAMVFDPNAPRHPSRIAAAAMGLEVAEIDFGPIEQVVRLSGTVKARSDRRVAIAAPVDGLLAQLGAGGSGRAGSLQTGDRVRRGEVLAVLNSPRLAQMVHEQYKTEVEYEHALSELTATRAGVETLRKQIDAADRQAAIAEQEVARLRASADAVAVNTLGQRESAAIQARAQVDALRAAAAQQSRELESMQRRAEASGRAAAALRNVITLVTALPVEGESQGADPDQVGVLKLRAPMDGVVVLRSVDGAGLPAAGQAIREGEVLLEVADFSEVQVEGEIPESLTGQISDLLSGERIEHEVRVRTSAEANVIAVGRVRALSPVVDPIKRTSHLVVHASNPDGHLREGMYVDLAVVLSRKTTAVVVPRPAVVSDGSLRFVFVRDRDGFVKHDVRLGVADDRVVEVLDGLVPGDQVVIRGAYALSQLRPSAAGADVVGEAPHGDPHDPHDHGHSH